MTLKVEENMATQDHDHKVRLSVDCTEEERKYIKILAARSCQTISEYLLSYARKDMPQCSGYHCKESHEPNETTKKALKESREGNLEIYESIDDFWSEMGMNS